MHSLIKRISAVCVEPSVSPVAWPVLALAEKGFAMQLCHSTCILEKQGTSKFPLLWVIINLFDFHERKKPLPCCLKTPFKGCWSKRELQTDLVLSVLRSAIKGQSL